KKYTKTFPLLYDEFGPVLKWWNHREANDHAWRVRKEDVLVCAQGNATTLVNLDIRNPNSLEQLEQRSPAELVAALEEKERQIGELVASVKEHLKIIVGEGPQ
ncbi:MAG: hypothetical protein WCA89_12620, partial [Terracidiphilus sp.]